MNLKKELETIKEDILKKKLSDKYYGITEKILKEGCYIWGTGLLGKFTYEQCKKNNIFVKGFIDNDSSKWNLEDKIFSFKVLRQEDIVILASLYYPDIIEQLEVKERFNYIFYEELALIFDSIDTYSPTFRDIFGELERNKKSYYKVYKLLTDKLSKEIYENLIMFRCTLDTKYIKNAWKLSIKEGQIDFDKIILNKLDKEYIFYDVGGFDGESTETYIKNMKEYHKIYFFEPDKLIIKKAIERLKNYKNIIFVQAGVGEKKEMKSYNAIGNGSGAFQENGNYKVDMIKLDDFVDSNKSYIKMDIEGYELQALKGAEKIIRKYKPILSVSVYHLPGDIHKFVNLILSWNPDYKLYIRHYTNSYTDTRMYFV